MGKDRLRAEHFCALITEFSQFQQLTHAFFIGNALLQLLPLKGLLPWMECQGFVDTRIVPRLVRAHIDQVFIAPIQGLSRFEPMGRP